MPQGLPEGGAGQQLVESAEDHSLAKYLETLTPMIQLSLDMIVSEDVATWQIYLQQFS